MNRMLFPRNHPLIEYPHRERTKEAAYKLNKALANVFFLMTSYLGRINHSLFPQLMTIDYDL